ncbi:MAG TPA: M13 family metallopeptidase, partial [Polyangiales bacterium]|nr:M13 family metallopeptidase [Polyangiales bacterium]
MSGVSRRSISWVALLLLFSSAACAADADRGPKATSIDWTAIDATADPCVDFYQYACGNWADAHPLADDAYSYSRFDQRGDAVSPKLRDIIEADANGDRQHDDPYAATIADLFNSCMNAPDYTPARDELRAWLAPVMAIASAEDLARQIATLAQLGSVALFSADSVRDADDPTRYIMRFDQGGYALRNRSDYLDDATADLRRAYRDHVRDLTAIFSDIAIDVDQAIAIETELAQAALTPAQQRDVLATHNPMSASDLAALAPNFAWDAYLDSAGLAMQQHFTITSPDYFRALDRLLADTPLLALQSYLALRLIQSKAAWLDREVAGMDFAFWSAHYDGRTAHPDRASICVDAVKARLSWPLAAPYIHRNDTGDLVERAKDVLEVVRASVHDRIAKADWADDATRTVAQQKLAAEIALIGHPSGVTDYSALALEPDSYLKNGVAIARFDHLRVLAALTAHAERDVWSDPPFLINTTYFTAKNLVEFPMAMLGEPFFAA